MPAAKVKAMTKYSAFEYQAGFTAPVLEPLKIFSTSSAIYSALKPWNVSPQNVKFRGGPLSTTESMVGFELAKGRYTVDIAMSNFRFKAEQVAWDQAPVITEIIAAIKKVVNTELKVGVEDHSLTISMQLAITEKSIRDLTFSASQPLGYASKDLDFFGFLLYTTNGSCVVDKSAADQNDLFVKIVRRYTGPHEMDEMAKGIHEDEDRLANALGIEIE